MARFVDEHPELGHEEHACSRLLGEVLATGGLRVERPVGGMDTAFRAVLNGARPGRTVGIVCLFDAVPAVRSDGSIEAVHSCGHAPIAGGVVAAALALAEHASELSGRLVVVGCPADEIHAPAAAARGGGKTLSVQAGLWDDVDTALYAHPEYIDTVSQRSRWMRREHLHVAGERSLSGRPEPPLQAALAALRANTADVMIERLALDGDVEEATGLVARADVLVFADTLEELERRCSALRTAVPQAQWTTATTIEGVRPDAAATAAVAEAFAACGREFVADPPPLPFATDFGNVSQRLPAALIGVGRPGGWAFHTDDGAAEFRSPAGDEASRALARVLALAAYRLSEPV